MTPQLLLRGKTFHKNNIIKNNLDTFYTLQQDNLQILQSFHVFFPLGIIFLICDKHMN